MTNGKKFVPTIVSPFIVNVLDLQDRQDLVLKNGDKVQVSFGQDRSLTEFVVTLNGEEVWRSRDNIQTSAFLNQLVIGTYR